MNCSMIDMPAPPYSLGQAGATHFFCASLARQAKKLPACSKTLTPPPRSSAGHSFSMKSRTSSRNASSSGVKRKSITVSFRRAGRAARSLPATDFRHWDDTPTLTCKSNGIRKNVRFRVRFLECRFRLGVPSAAEQHHPVEVHLVPRKPPVADQGEVHPIHLRRLAARSRGQLRVPEERRAVAVSQEEHLAPRPSHPPAGEQLRQVTAQRLPPDDGAARVRVP